ncbi:hypothetical protein PanWU01x14_082820 [Parasponia andersonii]|uniref:Uncharacterized protein n=1 Tax=Parasponia andersonii TaxID=3476 RepID=A0A2P5D9Z8_PARAD|nr:hypothetical protein PanWU01x14_082820 [Parasponia andersonii]
MCHVIKEYNNIHTVFNSSKNEYQIVLVPIASLSAIQLLNLTTQLGGLKNFSLSPLFTILHTPPMENAKLKAIPNQPRIQLKYQLKLYFVGFLMRTHMKQG